MTRINLTREQMKAAYEAGILTNDDLLAINLGDMLDYLAEGVRGQLNDLIANMDKVSEEAEIS